MTAPGDLNADAQRRWENIAPFWDAYIGADGNPTHRELIEPAQLDLLSLKPGERVLDVACGNGQFARTLARLGAEVVACDFSEPFLAAARRHTMEAGIGSIRFEWCDATDEAALLNLDPGPFDSVVCTMGVMDIADIRPLSRVARQRLGPLGRLVFSVIHPAFGNSTTSFYAERCEQGTEMVTEYGIKVPAYLDIPPRLGLGISGQPVEHFYFHRPLEKLLEPFFAEGFVLDGLREPAFAAPGRMDDPLRYSGGLAGQIPSILVVRLRPTRA